VTGRPLESSPARGGARAPFRLRWGTTAALVSGVALVAAAGGVAVWLAGAESSAGNERAHPAPNIVVILTDDQRWDTLSVMPVVRREMAGRGIEFTNSFVIDPVCCPSRASTLTGRYPHSTGVWRNHGEFGGFPAFDDASTVATWLHDSGYRTGLFGKYLNRYRGTTYVPPGWDRWMAFNGSSVEGDFYYRYLLNVDGRLQRHEADPADYSTNVLGAAAVSFIERTPGRLFVLFAPANPHRPGTAAPGDARRLDRLPPWRPPSYNEADVSDKPAWARAVPPLTAPERAEVDLQRQAQMASLLAVDRWVGRILRALEDTGRLQDTILVFTSDNGVSWGEHRWTRKVAPWEENLRVPLVIRYDRMIAEPRRDPHLVLNVDLAPTFAALARTAAPGAEGASLVPLIIGPEGPWREDFGVESLGTTEGPDVPAYCGVRTGRHFLAQYVTGELELYDLVEDPFQLANMAADPGSAALLDRLRARIRELCDPPPPLSPPSFPG
jgi:arylsulfatase A-like enzyme